MQILEGFGNTFPELESSLAQLGPLHIKTFDKMLFSLITPELLTLLKCPEQQNIKSVVLMGIEVRGLTYIIRFDTLLIHVARFSLIYVFFKQRLIYWRTAMTSTFSQMVSQAVTRRRFLGL